MNIFAYCAFFLFASTIHLTASQWASSGDKLCASNSLHSNIDGTYDYLYWDNTNYLSWSGPVFFNAATQKYLYPDVSDSGWYTYRISSEVGQSSINGYCSLGYPSYAPYTFDPVHCFDNWNYANDNAWEADMNMRLTYCNNVCVTGNDIVELNGIYEWQYVDNTNRGSVYYCRDCDNGNGQYIYPSTAGFYYKWRIESSKESSTDYNSCSLDSLGVASSVSSDYIFDFADCSEWERVYNFGSAAYKDADMTVQQCEPTPSPTPPPTSSPTTNPTPAPTTDPTLAPTENPTPAPTTDSTSSQTLSPTQSGALLLPSVTDSIIITNHNDIRDDWIAFNISNVDVSCNHNIDSVEVTDSFTYRNKWIKYDGYNNNYYEFTNLSDVFTPPISIRITATWNDTIIGTNIITALIGGKQFDFESNFCSKQSETNKIDYLYYYAFGAVVFIFIFIGFIATVDAKCFRRNDYFNPIPIVSALIQILDTMSDVFYVIKVFSYYSALSEENDENSNKVLLIFGLSICFVLFPVIISLYQLHSASTKYWLKDNRIREWLLSYKEFLYLVSVLTGSSFTATQIFSTNMFGLDLFYIGLSQKYLLSFMNKRLYSIILFENCPQLLLSSWFLIIKREFDYIAVSSMIFSCVSITVAIISSKLQKQLYNTQNYADISIDITGQCVIDSLEICERRVNGIKTYLCQSLFGVTQKSVQIQKPFCGSVANGLRLYVRVALNDVNDNYRYHNQLKSSTADGSLVSIIESEWDLSSTPHVTINSCEFIESKVNIQFKDKQNNTGNSSTEGEATQVNNSSTAEGEVMPLSSNT